MNCSMREHHLCSRRWNYRIVLAYFPDALAIVVLTCSHFILKILSNLLLSDYFLSPIVTKIFCKTIYKESININLKTNWLHLIKYIIYVFYTAVNMWPINLIFINIFEWMKDLQVLCLSIKFLGLWMGLLTDMFWNQPYNILTIFLRTCFTN